MSQLLARSTLLLVLAMVTLISVPARAAGGSFGKVEASFELPQIQGNPFDFTQNDVQVTLTLPGGHEITLPAFFDGGHTWRIRHTPDTPGTYTIRLVTLNGKDANPQQFNSREFVVSGSPDNPPRPGFVRIDPNNKMRFAFDNGSVYYPVGYDLAWHQNGSSPMPALTESLARMGKARVNWTRIWMDHWDGKNLDWAQRPADQVPLGQLDLATAKRWDAIVDAAQANGVYFQMVLQHHGQVGTGADANWGINPWNKANGGWLEKPAQFFTDPKAIALTKAKYRYIIARWGYSPAIMAWELFNEVENSDPFKTNLNDVASWHVEMAKFVREFDSYHHLITTSARSTEPKLWPATDYYQAHAYPSDMLSAIANFDAQKLNRPYFLGEYGGSLSNGEANPAEVVHRGLWGSLMSQSSGAAQYWYWYVLEPKGLQFNYTAAQKFIDLSGFPSRENLKPIQVEVQTAQRGLLKFGPGIDWAPSRQTHFTLSPNGAASAGGMSAYLQGQGNNREMFPFATFDVDYPSAGTFAVHVDQTTANGAKLELSVDGQPPSSLSLGENSAASGNAPANAASGRSQGNTTRINATLAISVAAGKHTVRMENTGADWIHIRDFTLNPYAPALTVLAKGNADSAVLWIFRRDHLDPAPITGSVSLPGLTEGSYRVVWWDTYKGEIVKEEVGQVTGNQSLTFATPPIAQDLAVFIEPGRTRP